MSIIIKNKNTTRTINKEDFEKENYLQDLISKNPESVPIYEIEEDRKLLIINREHPTESGPIDAIGIDNKGNLYVIETKLYKNPDKRNVVAQALDYGSSLWAYTQDEKDFFERADSFLKKSLNIDLNTAIQTKFEIPKKEIDEIKERVIKNLNDGNIKFVVLMNKLDERLKDLILYINENSKFDIYAVELEYYKHNDLEILIPKLYGNEVKKDIGIKKIDEKFDWTEETILEKIKNEVGQKESETTKSIMNFVDKNGLIFTTPRNKTGTYLFGFENEEYNWWTFSISKGSILWNAQHHGNYENYIKPFNNKKNLKNLIEKFSNIKDTVIGKEETKESFLKIPLSSLNKKEELKKFFDILIWIKQEVGKINK